MSWRVVAMKDLRQGVARLGPHNMTKRILHWFYCVNCGLLALNNEASRLALRRPCVWEDA